MKKKNYFRSNLKNNPLGLIIGLGAGLAIALPVSIFAAPQTWNNSSSTPAPSSSGSTSLVNPGTDEDEPNSEPSASKSPTATSRPNQSSSSSSATPAATPAATTGTTSASSEPPPNFVAQTTPQSATAPVAPVAPPLGSVTSLQYFNVSGTGRATCSGANYVSGRVVIPSLPDWRGVGTDVYSATYVQESNGGRATNGRRDVWSRDSLFSSWSILVSGGWTPTVEVRCSRLVTTQITPTPTASPSPTSRTVTFTERGTTAMYCATFRADSVFVSGQVVGPWSWSGWDGVGILGHKPLFTEADKVKYPNGGFSEGWQPVGLRTVEHRQPPSGAWAVVFSENYTPEVEITCSYTSTQ